MPDAEKYNRLKRLFLGFTGGRISANLETVMKRIATFATCIVLMLPPFASAGIHDRANRDESKVPQYELPDALSAPRGGAKASSAAEWLALVRPQVRDVFENEIYGPRPPRPAGMTFEEIERGEAFGGLGERVQVRATVSDAKGSRSFDILMYVPKGAPGEKFPVFLSLNFMGNHATCDDPKILLKDIFDRADGTAKKAVEADRGKQSRRWPFEKILKRGYAVATVYYGDIYPDYPLPDAAEKSVYAIFDKDRLPARGGAISAWSWGLSRAMDYLESAPEIDSEKIILCGHSRLGKTSLLTGALDGRAAITISNNSGCMGSALSRRRFGETVDFLCLQFPHWLAEGAQKYRNRENEMPIDQHQLMALVAPRPLYITSATEDWWADPRGEFLALMEASKVYSLFGAEKLPTLENFKPEAPFFGNVGYHMRVGKHDVLWYDWDNYIKFADSRLFPKGRK